ncbi:MAG: cupin domain-containing protein [Hyphomicrobiaceae bacterium]
MTIAQDIIRLLDLTPHPEGGYYRETFRDPVTVQGRAVSTCIYFLLPEGVISRWHRVDAVETWHWYAGAPLDLRIAEDAKIYTSHVLGSDLSAGERPQHAVPESHWQQARSMGAWTLVGCTVAPGFVFEGFEIAGAEFDPAPV